MLGRHQATAFTLFLASQVALSQKDFEAARQYAQEALVMADRGEALVDRVHILIGLGDILFQQGQLQAAKRSLSEALKNALYFQTYPLILVGLELWLRIWAMEAGFLAESAAKIGRSELESEVLIKIIPLLLHHPAGFQWLRDRANHLFNAVAPTLPIECIEAALKRGWPQDLEEMAAGIGQILQSSGPK